MKLREEILKEHSKKQCASIVSWIGNSQTRFDELFKLFLNDEYRVVQRAAWPVSYCVIDHPELISKHWTNFVKNLSKPGLHNAVKRNSVRLLQEISIPKKHQGDIMNICFAFVQSPAEEVSVKAFSLTVLGNLAKIYPEIIPELSLMIEDHVGSQTPPFRSRAKKLLKQFEKSRPW